MSSAGINGDGNRLRITGVLDFDNAPPLEREGRDWLRQAPADCVLDLSDVTYSSSAGLAVLLSWLRAAAALGKRTIVVGMPEDLQALARVGGVEALFPESPAGGTATAG